MSISIFFAYVVKEPDYYAYIHFTPNLDICGEGYEGYDVTIVFDNPAFNSTLWSFDPIRADSQDEIKASAIVLYDLIVALIKQVRA